MTGAAPGRAAGLVLAVVGAVAFSGKAIIAKLAYRYGVDAITLVMLRMLFALPVFLAMAWWASRGQAPLTLRQWGSVLFLGTSGYYLASTLDFLGLLYVSASLERLILYLNPTLVVVLGWLLHHKRILPRQWLAVGTSYAGVLVVFGHEIGAQGAHAALGAALCLGSAVSYAFYLLYSGRLVQTLGSLRLVGLASSVACLLCIIQFLLLRPIETGWQVAPEVLWLSLLNASVCTVVPILLVMLAIERIGAGATAQAGMIGPMSTIGLGAWLLGEPLTLWVALGTALVLSGIWMFSRARA
jgi:drug/metabolite transporter (DMT)-like permease